MSATLTSGAVNAAAAIPALVKRCAFTHHGTYYMTADRERILAFFRRTFPRNLQQRSILLKNNLFHSLFGQVKSQLMVSLIITTFLVLSLVIYGVKYGLLIGILIGVMDALPVLGAGLFSSPYACWKSSLATMLRGYSCSCVYIGTIVIRQIFEPRIVGANLGLYPLTTMIAMFALSVVWLSGFAGRTDFAQLARAGAGSGRCCLWKSRRGVKPARSGWVFRRRPVASRSTCVVEKTLPIPHRLRQRTKPPLRTLPPITRTRAY